MGKGSTREPGRRSAIVAGTSPVESRGTPKIPNVTGRTAARIRSMTSAHYCPMPSDENVGTTGHVSASGRGEMVGDDGLEPPTSSV